MARLSSVSNSKDVSKIKRPGIHSKNNTSKLKKSKNYKKAYRETLPFKYFIINIGFLSTLTSISFFIIFRFF
jgi:hypothetical protein